MARALVNAAKVDGSFLQRAINQADEFHLYYWCTQDGTSGYNASYGNCGDRYYDDNAWIALALLRLYELTGDSTYLGWAQDTIAFCMTGENGPGDIPDGGIRWHESNTSGASICSTAPTTLANLILYYITGIKSYKTDGLRLYNWLITADDYRLASGVFHESGEGPRGYQTAVVTQAAIRLYQITGNNSYLQEAQSMASAMEAHFINSTTHALVEIGKWGGHDMTNAYVELYEVDSDIHWLDVVADYLEYLYINCIDNTTGLYPEQWDDTSGNYSEYLIDNAAVASAFWKMSSVAGNSNIRVKLFQDCNYDGWLAAFEMGSYTTSDIIAAGGWNNDASSLTIEPGYKATFYSNDNFTGATLVKTADDSCLVDEGWNDQISSMIVDIDPTLLGYWQFNDNGGSIIIDASGYAHDGQLINMEVAAWTQGKQCGGLNFDGVDDAIEISGFKGVVGSSGRTCTAWIKTSQISGEILAWGNFDNGGKWIIRVNEGGQLRAEVQGGNIIGTTLINDDNWHHIAVALENDGSPDISEAQLYVDGQRETISAFVDEPVNTSGDQDVAIGVFMRNQIRYFQGLIDEVRIYNYPLTATEIQDIYQQYVLVSDTEPDGDVDLNDFAVLAGSWQSTDSCDVDLTCDCAVDMIDLIVIMNEWLSTSAVSFSGS